MTSPKRKITNFNFESDGAHVALVDKAANQQEVLVMKSSKASEEEIKKAVEVNIKLPLLEFLTRYMYMDIDEAETIAGMLGYSFEDLYEEGEMSGFRELVESNLDKVTVSKSESAQKFVGAFEEFKQKYLTKASSSVEDGESVSKSTEDKITKPEEEVNKMTEENKVENPTQDDIQEMITKALKDQEADIRKAVEAEYEDKHKQTTAQLEVLKAKEEAREEKSFINKAAEFKEHLGAEEDKQADAVTDLAKALRKMEADEECKPAIDLLKSLKETVEKSALLDEVGGASPIEKSGDYQTEGDKLVMKMVKDEGITEAKAYAKVLTEQPHLFQ